MYVKEPTKEGVNLDKIWLKSYPAGVPAEINPDAYQSIVEVFEQSCQRFQDRPAFYNMGKTLSYQQLDNYSRAFAAYLQQVLKLEKGDHLAIMLPNTLQYPIAMYGALRAGLIVVNVNPLYRADELVYQLNNAEVKTLIVLSMFTQEVADALPRLPLLKNIIVTHLGDLFSPLKRWVSYFALKYFYKKIPHVHLPAVIYLNNLLTAGEKLTLTPVKLVNQDIAFLQYTGGTTGISKGAILTHRNIIANLQQAEAWFKSTLQAGQEITITALPLYHIFSLLANCLFFTSKGAFNILITNPRQISAMVKEMKKFKFTVITGVNTLFNALLNDPEFANLDFSGLKLALGGGMAVQAAVAERWHEVTGSPLLEAYGLTETSPCVTINPPHLKAFNSSIGLPVPSTEVCFLDDKGRPVAIGESGELAVKGPQVMKNYWKNPEETAKVFTADGWLLTGDVGMIDEQGFVHILERKKDIIIVSGFNVYPNAIEDVLSKLPGVREAAVVGVPDEHSGEAVKAYIIKSDPKLTVEQVIAHCKKHLTGYKVPKTVEFCQDLPKSYVGKILRRALRS